MAERKQNPALATALSFANLGLEQQALSDRANAARVAQAMQMLGLMQEQEQAQARNAQAMEALNFQREDLGFRKEDAGAQRTQAGERIAVDREKIAADAAQQKARDELSKSLGVMDYLRNAVGVDPSVGLGFAAKVDPRLGEAQTEARARALSEQIAKLTGTYGALDPKGRKVMEATLTPEVVAGLQTSQPTPTTPAPAAPAGPPVVELTPQGRVVKEYLRQLFGERLFGAPKTNAPEYEFPAMMF